LVSGRSNALFAIAATSTVKELLLWAAAPSERLITPSNADTSIEFQSNPRTMGIALLRRQNNNFAGDTNDNGDYIGYSDVYERRFHGLFAG